VVIPLLRLELCASLSNAPGSTKRFVGVSLLTTASFLAHKLAHAVVGDDAAQDKLFRKVTYYPREAHNKLVEKLAEFVPHKHKTKKFEYEPADAYGKALLRGAERKRELVPVKANLDESLKFHKSDMPKNGKKSTKKSNKAARKAVRIMAAGPLGGGPLALPAAKAANKAYRRAFNRAGKKGPRAGRASAVIGATRAQLPKLLKMGTSAGLTMKGGWISGHTEIVPDLQLTSAANVAGTVLYQTAVHPLLMAPGSRFADLASNYDLYEMLELQVTLGSDIPFTLNGMIGGGFERDPGDPLPAVGGILDVPKYMEHQNFHAESIANKRGLRFPQSNKSVNSTKGPFSGMFFNRLPATGNDITSLYQGQLIVFVHTALSADTAAITFPISLGPLTLKWKCRFKEAAEKNNLIGNADQWRVNVVSPIGNAPNWTTGLTKQANMTPWSTLGTVSNWDGGTNFSFTLPIGYYTLRSCILYGTTGAADFYYTPYTTVQSGLTLLDKSSAINMTRVSQTNQFQLFYVDFVVTNPGTYILFFAGGNATGWAIAGGGSTVQILLAAMPIGENTFLQSKDHVMRSLAQARFREESKVESQVSKAVSAEFAKRGMLCEEKKVENKYDKLIERRHYELLVGPEQKKPRPDEETKQEWMAEHFAEQAVGRRAAAMERLRKIDQMSEHDWDEVESPPSHMLADLDERKKQWNRLSLESKTPTVRAPGCGILKTSSLKGG